MAAFKKTNDEKKSDEEKNDTAAIVSDDDDVILTTCVDETQTLKSDKGYFELGRTKYICVLILNLNATAGTCEEMIKRAVFAKELGVPIVMHDYLTCGFTANTSLAHYCRDNGLLLHIHRAMHAVIDRQKNHGMHFRVLAKALRLSGGDHIHSGIVVGKLEGEVILSWTEPNIFVFLFLI
ncbi:uncharacterized protein LOC111302700 [Durio zibethinus]|uniref:Uncharacterized protein LOC111302700 n=1 Tax=Durio zibethinus TaxID=66656 RepID=A0A6P5ZPC9_DURZI|nr:uncharacterized protein LOC111302700 [Durio zibethinus]